MYDQRTEDFSDDPHADNALGIGDKPPGHFEEDEEELDRPGSSPYDSPLGDNPVGDLGGPEADENLDDLMDEELGAGGGAGSGPGAGRRP